MLNRKKTLSNFALYIAAGHSERCGYRISKDLIQAYKEMLDRKLVNSPKYIAFGLITLTMILSVITPKMSNLIEYRESKHKKFRLYFLLRNSHFEILRDLVKYYETLLVLTLYRSEDV